MSHAPPGERDGTDAVEGTAPPDVNSDRLAPTRPSSPARSPLPIEEIEEEEDDSKGG